MGKRGSPKQAPPAGLPLAGRTGPFTSLASICISGSRAAVSQALRSVGREPQRLGHPGRRRAAHDRGRRGVARRRLGRGPTGPGPGAHADSAPRARARARVGGPRRRRLAGAARGGDGGHRGHTRGRAALRHRGRPGPGGAARRARAPAAHGAFRVVVARGRSRQRGARPQPGGARPRAAVEAAAGSWARAPCEDPSSQRRPALCDRVRAGDRALHDPVAAVPSLGGTTGWG